MWFLISAGSGYAWAGPKAEAGTHREAETSLYLEILLLGGSFCRGSFPASSTDLTTLPPHTPHSTIYQRLSACAVCLKWLQNGTVNWSHTDKEWLKEPMELEMKVLQMSEAVVWKRQRVGLEWNRCVIQAQRMICLLAKKSPPPRRPGPACWSRSSWSCQALKPKLGDYCKTRELLGKGWNRTVSFFHLWDPGLHAGSPSQGRFCGLTLHILLYHFLAALQLGGYSCYISFNIFTPSA